MVSNSLNNNQINMSKSFKFKNNMYLDSKGIVHNKELLSEFLDKLNKKIVGTVLFEDITGSTSNITLSEKISNFKRIKIVFGNTDRMEIKEFYTNNINSTNIHFTTGYWATDTIYQIVVASLLVSDTTLVFKSNRYINLSSNQIYIGGTVDYTKIYKVIGYQE